MRISETGIWTAEQRADPDRNARRRSFGFTLLEVLVVVALLAIVGAALTLALGARDERELVANGERILALLDYARDAAIASDRVYGCYLSPAAVTLLVHDGRQWRTPAGGSAGTTVALAPPFALRGAGVAEDAGSGAPRLPQLLFLPDGERRAAAFAIVDTAAGETRAIVATPAGGFALAAER